MRTELNDSYSRFVKKYNGFDLGFSATASAAVKIRDPLPAAGASFKPVAVPALIALSVLLLAAAFWVVRSFGSRRSRLGRRSPGRLPDSFLPAARSALLPRSHHETLHDPRYLDRILQAELDDQGDHQSGTDDRSDDQSSADRDHGSDSRGRG
jgi:hypothetical protein